MTELPNTFGYRNVGGRHRPAIAERAEIFRRVKTVASRLGKTAGGLAVARGAVRLRAVLDHGNSQRVADGDDPLDLGKTPVKMRGIFSIGPKSCKFRLFF